VIADIFNLSGSREMGPLLVFSIIILTGVSGGWVARRFHAPGITGNIVAGMLLGATLLNNVDAVEVLQPLSIFAMALITVSVGGQLSYRRIHNALRRIVIIVVLEATCGAIVVTLVVRMLGAGWLTAVLLGSIAAATAPATTLAIIRENRAKGTFVKTLLAVVALDNILCIVFFAFTKTVVADYYADPETGLQFSHALLHTGIQLIGSLILGIVLGYVTERLVRHPSIHNFSTLFVAILLTTGLSSYFGLSPLLTSLFFGVYLGNTSKEAEEQLDALEPIELLLYTCFFTLAGVSLHLDNLWHAGLLFVAYVLARFLGKGLGASLGGIISRSSKRIWSNIPLGLVPQAGVAIGLVVLLEGDHRIPHEISALVATVVLTAATINEIIGPLFTRTSLIRSKETGLDRRRLIEFLHEEFILVNLQAEDKWDLLGKLTDFFVRTHNVPPDQRDTIFATVKEREQERTTAIGHGIAIPHGRVDSGTAIQGVLGICRAGVDFDAPDGAPVKLAMLIVTPKEHEKNHLEIMAALTSLLSSQLIRQRLVSAIDANDAWEVIEYEEHRDYNYFLEETEESNANA